MHMFKRLPIHSLLFACYPILALLGNNITEVPLDVIVRPLLISVIGMLLLILLLRLVTGDMVTAGLVTTLSLILFFTYGHVYQLLKENPFTSEIGIGRHRFLLIFYVLLFASGIYLLLRGRKLHTNLNAALNLMGIVLLVVPTFQITQHSIITSSVSNTASQWTPNIDLTVTSSQETRPDVYYIILDGYARADYILDTLDYDNTPFLDQLRQLGFVIGDCSRSNYHGTRESLLSSLNMAYLNDIYKNAPSQEISDESAAFHIANSEVRKQFEALGYKIVAYDTGYEWLNMRDADLYLSFTTTPYGVSWVTPFEELLINTSLASVYTDLHIQDYFKQYEDSNHPKSYFINREKFKLNELPKIVQIAEPTFTYAHILIPHTPFVFGPEGILTDPGYFGGGSQHPINTEYFQDGYIKEIQFANQQMLTIIPYILENSPTPPIIILQGDHGFGDNHHPILNAYYLPGEGEQYFYASISPVNTYRIIFDAYFGGSYGLVPDESYSKGLDQKVPEILPHCSENP